jgi:hypothetical protein
VHLVHAKHTPGAELARKFMIVDFGNSKAHFRNLMNDQHPPTSSFYRGEACFMQDNRLCPRSLVTSCKQRKRRSFVVAVNDCMQLSLLQSNRTENLSLASAYCYAQSYHEHRRRYYVISQVLSGKFALRSPPAISNNLPVPTKSTPSVFVAFVDKKRSEMVPGGIDDIKTTDLSREATKVHIFVQMGGEVFQLLHYQGVF